MAGTVRVLQLSPFGVAELTNYVHAAVEGRIDAPSSMRLRELIAPGAGPTPTAVALERCAEEPAILARLVDELKEFPERTELELLKNAIEGSLIAFNLEA